MRRKKPSVTSAPSKGTPAVVSKAKWIMALACLLVAPMSLANEDGNHESHFEPNEVGLFFGGTVPLDEFAAGHAGYTLGIEYERRFNPTFGAMIIAEYVSEKHKRESLAATLFAYRIKQFRLAAGPGVELLEKDEQGGSTKESSYFLFATRATYNVHLRRFTLSPTIGLDFIGESKTNIVLGLALGYGF